MRSTPLHVPPAEEPASKDNPGPVPDGERHRFRVKSPTAITYLRHIHLHQPDTEVEDTPPSGEPVVAQDMRTSRPNLPDLSVYSALVKTSGPSEARRSRDDERLVEQRVRRRIEDCPPHSKPQLEN